MTRYTLRPATAADLPRLLEVHEGAFRPLVETRYPWDPAEQRRILAESLHRAQLVLVDERVVGQLIVTPQEGAVFLERILLAPEVQGRGLGTALVETVIADARARGLPVTLSVWDTNRARALYTRLGFRVTHHEGFRVKMQLDP